MIDFDKYKIYYKEVLLEDVFDVDVKEAETLDGQIYISCITVKYINSDNRNANIISAHPSDFVFLPKTP